jgi:hypothetical protein
LANIAEITVDWTVSPRLITIPPPITEVSVQDLYDSLRFREELRPSYPVIASAGGKESLGAGTSVAVTLTLLDAQISWGTRPSNVVCKITGGNIVAVDAGSVPIDVLTFTPNVNAFIAQSSSATVSDVSLTARLQHLIAAQDETHSPYGDVFYWDPINGDDSNDGLLPETAQKTFASIHDNLCSGTTRDTVFLLARDPGGGTTIINERIVITKDHVLLHGPGRGACIRGLDDAQDTIEVNGAYGVEIDSMRVQTGPGPTARNAISVLGGSDHVKLSNLYLDVQAGEYITGNGVSIVGGTHHIIDNVFIESTGDDGIHLEDTISTRVERCKIFTCSSSGVHITASGPGLTNQVTLNDNVVQHSVVYDLHIDTDVTNTAVRFLNDITDAASILDNGTDTQWERLNQAQQSAFYNWEEPVAVHLTPGTVGYASALANYRGSIHIDTILGAPGTVFGTNGTAGNPVNTLADAVTLASTSSIRSYVIRGSIALTSAHTSWSFAGVGPEDTVNINGQDVSDSFFNSMKVVGDAADSEIHGHDTSLSGVTDFCGIFTNCRLSGTLRLAAGSTMFAHSVSFVPGAGGTPVLDVQGAGRSFHFRSYSGGVRIQNMSDASNAGSVEFVAGQCILDNTCTDGDLALRGVATLTDNSSGTSVNTTALLSASTSIVPEVKQAWTRAVTGGSKLRAVVALELDGQVVTLPGTATLAVTVRDSAGTAIFSQSGLSPNGQGYFSLEQSPYDPPAGQVLASFVTIVNGADTYSSVTELAIPEFD